MHGAVLSLPLQFSLGAQEKLDLAYLELTAFNILKVLHLNF